MKIRPLWWALIQFNWCPHKEIRTYKETQTPDSCMHREKRQREGGHVQAQGFRGNNPADTLVSGFQNSEKIDFSC